MFIRVKGDVVQNIDLSIRKDSIFASGKYIEMENHKKVELNNSHYVQFISNDVNNDLELVIINAISSAKKSLQFQLSQFIPTESIMSLLKYAINSNIEVKLMVPLKNYKYGKYFASRAYAKELALLGANVYLYDGYINFNSITIDDEYVITGSYLIDREHLNTSSQNMLLIKDRKLVLSSNKLFANGVDNSYRINNAKFMLLREKFFKNFV
jgi:phosphatidylserine/phosphatidylglycerophosphate/cardiolipin synthase-like enzyme